MRTTCSYEAISLYGLRRLTSSVRSYPRIAASVLIKMTDCLGEDRLDRSWEELLVSLSAVLSRHTFGV